MPNTQYPADFIEKFNDVLRRLDALERTPGGGTYTFGGSWSGSTDGAGKAAITFTNAFPAAIHWAIAGFYNYNGGNFTAEVIASSRTGLTVLVYNANNNTAVANTAVTLAYFAEGN